MKSPFSYSNVHVLHKYCLSVFTLPQAVRMCAWFIKNVFFSERGSAHAILRTTHYIATSYREPLEVVTSCSWFTPKTGNLIHQYLKTAVELYTRLNFIQVQHMMWHWHKNTCGVMLELKTVQLVIG